MTDDVIPIRGRPRKSDAPVIGKVLTHILDDGGPISLARAFVAEHYMVEGIEQIARYLADTWRFNPDDGYYTVIDEDDLAAQVRAFLDGVGIREVDGDEARTVPLKVTSRIVSETIAALNDARRARVPSTARLPFALAGYTGPDPVAVLVVKNGVVHLETGRLYPKSPFLFATSGSSATFDPTATCPEWEKFQVSIFTDDDGVTDWESIRLLQMWVGYLLTLDTSQQKILLLLGPRRSGKGTIARTVTALLGDGNVAAPTLSSLQGPFGLASLVGKSLAIVGDARVGKDPATVTERLLSISGEDAITVDRKFRNAIDVRLSTRIAIITNELPYLADASGALASRFSIIETRRSFLGAEDHELEQRLLGELPGILNWAIAGWRDLQRAGRLPTPARAVELQDEMERLGSPIKGFAADQLVFGPGHEVEVGSVYESWKSWCHENGKRDAGRREVFGRSLHAAYPAIKTTQKTLPNGNRPRVYVGLTLKGGRDYAGLPR